MRENLLARAHARAVCESMIRVIAFVHGLCCTCLERQTQRHILTHAHARAHTYIPKNAPSTVVNVTCEDYALCNGLDLLYVARMEKDASKAGRLRVLVEYCRDLPSSHGVGSTNSYIKVLMAGQEQRTATKKFTVNPVFNERMNFLLSDHDESHVHNTTMTLEVYLPGTNKDATDQLIGKVLVLPTAGFLPCRQCRLKPKL